MGQDQRPSEIGTSGLFHSSPAVIIMTIDKSPQTILICPNQQAKARLACARAGLAIHAAPVRGMETFHAVRFSPDPGGAKELASLARH